MLELTIKTLDGSNHSFTLADESTVLQLKESIFEKIEVPISSQRLIYHGKVLRDDKKLSDYGDVNGKVIHLVERPPPSSSRPSDSTSGRRSESSAQGGGTNRRFPRRDGPPGFLSSMTIPAFGIGHHDIVEGVDIPVRPSQMMARNRLECASRMIGYARQSIRHMADPNNPPPFADAPRQARRQASSRASSSGSSTANRGTSTNASQAAQSAEQSDPNGMENASNMVMADIAMIAEVLTGQVTPSGHVTLRRQRLDDSQRREGLPPDVVTPTTYHEDIASEVEIGDTASTETDATTEVRDNSAESRPVGGRPDNRARVDAMVPLLTDLEGINTELQPYLARCRELLSSDTTFDENSNPTQRDATRIFVGVTEALHSIAHASHALSDLMVDFNEDAPRFLRCRPVVLQHSTILEGIPLGMSVDEVVVNNEDTNPSSGRTPSARLAAALAASAALAAHHAHHPPGRPMPTTAAAAAAAAAATPAGNNSTTNASATAPVPPAPSDTANTSNPSPREPRGPFPMVDLSRIDRFPSLEVFFDYRRSDRNGAEPASGAQPQEGMPPPPPPPANAAPFDINVRYGQLRDQILGVLTGEPALAAQAAALASTANLWPNSNNGENNTDEPLPEIRPTELDAVLNSQQPWLPRSGMPSTTSTGINAAPEQTATGSQTTPPRRPGVPPMISMMNMIFQDHFDPALPCSSHHIRSPRRTPQPNRMLWEMFPPFEPPSVRIITRLGGTSRPTPEGGNAPANTATNQVPPAPDASQQPSPAVDVRRVLLDLISSDNIIMSPVNGVMPPANDIFEVEGATNGASLIRDFIRIMLQEITPNDFVDLAAARYNALLNRLRPTIQDFVTRHLLQNEDPSSSETIRLASDRVYTAFRPYIEVMHVSRFRHNINLLGTIKNFIQTHMREVVDIVLAPDNTAVDFGAVLLSRFTHYLRQLLAIVIYCCEDSREGFDTLVRKWVRVLTQDAPASVRQWSEMHSVNNMNLYVAQLNILPEEIQHYLVRMPGASQDTQTAAQEPMETDGAVAAPVIVIDDSTINRVNLETENLPEVLMGSEPWHGTVPSEWVPVIARDTQRQRRQSSQKPLSDAYMSGMPPKRRKLISTTKPQGETLPQAISEGVRHAIQAAGVSSPMAERAIAEAGHDRSLQKAYKMQEKATVGPILSEDPDFNPTRFPNAHSFFKK